MPRPSQLHRRSWVWVVMALLLVAGISVAVTIAVMRTTAGTAAKPAASPSSAHTTPQFSAAEMTVAKQNLCQAFDVSVRGQEGQGGVRVAGGDVNTTMVLRAMNSAFVVQTALAPAVPPNVVAAAKKYIATTLDQTTAAMGNTPTSEVNRLTDVRNEAIYALVNVCGLPR